MATMLHLLRIPFELRLRIYEYVLHNIELHAENGISLKRKLTSTRSTSTTTYTFRISNADNNSAIQTSSANHSDNQSSDTIMPPEANDQSEDDQSDNNLGDDIWYDDSYSDDEQSYRTSVPYYEIWQSPALLYVSKQVHDEIVGMGWQSYVRYNFPSTIAMLDILTVMTEEQRGLLRRIRVLASPLMLNNITHFMPASLALLPGLKLDLLEIVDHFFSDPDSWAAGGVEMTALELACSDGWREAHLLVKRKSLVNVSIDNILTQLAKIKRTHGKPAPSLEFSVLQVGSNKKADDFANGSQGLTGTMWKDVPYVREIRGQTQSRTNVCLVFKQQAGITYTQTRDGNLSKVMENLRTKIKWCEMRKTDYMLRGEGLIDPCAML